MMDIGSKTAVKRELVDLDPDYQNGLDDSEAKRRCVVEESDQGRNQQRVVEVVVRELDSTLAEKENEVLQLQERVQDCQRALRLLRFGIVSTFYSNVPTSEASADSSRNSEGQSAIHPAVLRLLNFSPAGSGPKTRGGRKKHSSEVPREVAHDTSFQAGCSDTERKCQDESNEKKVRNDDSGDKEKNVEENEKKEISTKAKMPRYVPPIMPDVPEVRAASARMERHQIKRRLVVGNISKWLPEDVRDDPCASHKWMLYLRGPKDSPDVSDIVAKVRYFLHPSYQPHDIVDVVSPFYLSRRGWGEFPVRVQVHFAIDGNRPIDIIHSLKLDRTYSGLQTLGGETVVDVWLRTVPSIQNVEQSSDPSSQQNVQKQLSTESQTTVFNDGHHEITAHDTRTVLVKQEKCEEEEEVKESEEEESLFEKTLENGNETEIKVKEEPLDEDDFYQDDSEIYDEEEDEEEEVKEREEEVHVFEKTLENWNETEIEVKEEPLDENDFYQDDNDSRKPSLSHVFHVLPDHDYLGKDPIVLKCSSCVNQGPSRGVSEVKSLKEEEKEKDVKTVLKGGALAKTVRTEAITKGDDGLSSESQVIHNGIVNSKSLIECVDTTGNVLYIDLWEPTSKYETPKVSGNLAISSVAQLQQSTSDNAVYCTDLKRRISDNKILKKNQITPSTSIHAGQSLLKKNYQMSPIPTSPPTSLSSEIRNIPGSSDAAQPKLALCKSHLHPQILKSKPDPNNLLLKEATHVLPKISDDCQAVIWVLRQLPLIDEHVNKDLEFRKQHPYCASSVDTFFTWPVAKRHCAERLRAKAAHGILQTVDSKRFAKWSVRHIMTWSRFHALTLLPSGKCEDQVQQKSFPVSTLRPTMSVPSEIQGWLESVAEASKAAEELEDINVVDIPVPPQDFKTPVHTKETSSSVMVWTHSKLNLDNFLREPLGRLDIRLAPEELCPGVLYPAAEELLYQACLSLSEDLLRRSMHQAWNRCQQTPNEIVLCDVQKALLSRSEFDILTNAGLGVQTHEYKSK